MIIGEFTGKVRVISDDFSSFFQKNSGAVQTHQPVHTCDKNNHPS